MHTRFHAVCFLPRTDYEGCCHEGTQGIVFWICLLAGFLLFFSPPPLFPSAEDALSSYIAGTVLEFAKNKFPLQCPDTLILVKTKNYRALNGNILYVPSDIWGYKTTNNYSLHFYTGILLFLNILQKQYGEKGPKDFFFNSGRASEYALQYIRTLEEKDSMLGNLMVYNYVFRPYADLRPDILICRDYTNDSLRFICIQKSILGYRCDSTAVDSWVFTNKNVNYAIMSVAQKPVSWKMFSIQIALKNKGELTVPFSLLLDFGRGDSTIRIGGFQNDTVIQVSTRQSLLKIVIDPEKKLFDVNEKDKSYISTEFSNKRKAYKLISILILDIISAASAIFILLFLGIFIQRLASLYFKDNLTWTCLFIALFLILKLSFPFILFGFNLWGFVYTINIISSTTSTAWIAVSGILVFATLYYLFVKDGAHMNSANSYCKYILTAILLEPFLCSLGF
jgi:hypothetical protein